MCFRPVEIELKKCPACGAANKPIAKVCENCGAELPDMVIDREEQQKRFAAEARAEAAAPAAPAAPKPPSAPGKPGEPL